MHHRRMHQLTQKNEDLVRTTDATPGVVYTLIDTAGAELQKADLKSAPSQEASTHSNQTDKEVELGLKKTIETLKPEANQTETEAETEKDNVPKEDKPKTNETQLLKEHTEEIPSFSEWTQKQLEEAEKKKELVNESTNANNFNAKQNSSSKVRSKNYASPDCGAKIVAANPEATNAGAVLSSSKDEYYLNVCTNRIWFIVELCEAIQAKKIDIANFELFSSSPKDFTVSVNARFPSREWSVVGQFIAKEEKEVQSFDLHPHLFGKYIKVEVHSHYGSEHFCPISLFKVYGTSEFEVLEKEDSAHPPVDDDDDDDTLDSEKGSPTNNLFHSATNAVISIVKKAVEVMGNKGNNTNENNELNKNGFLTPLIGTCTTVSHLVICENCNDVIFGQIYELLSCKSKELDKLASNGFIKHVLTKTELCNQFGVYLKTNMQVSSLKSSYLNVILPKNLLGALCNRLAVIENKALLNISNKFANTTKSNLSLTEVEQLTQINVIDTTNTEKETEKLTIENTEFTLKPEGITEISYNTEIKPTKTLSPDDLNDTKFVSVSEAEITSEKVVHSTETLPVPPKVEATAEKVVELDIVENELNENISEYETTTESAEGIEDNFDNIIADLNSESNPSTTSATVAKTVSPGPKESVFLRLSNRIKALERNMSLSSQYLEELSRRYKKQVEEMQKLLDKTLSTWSEERKQRDERTKRLEEQVDYLTTIIESLVADKNNWANATYWTFIIVIIVTGFFTFCRRTTEPRQIEDGDKVKVKRRKSIDIVRHKIPDKKKRRPSEEALKISGSYQHLMLEEANKFKKSKERKRRKKKTNLPRSNSMITLIEEGSDTRNNSSGIFNTNGNSKLWVRKESAPAQSSFNENERSYIEDIPFALEEAENSALEDIPSKTEIAKSKSSPEYMNGNLQKLEDSLFTNFIKTARESRLSRTSISLQLNGHQNLENIENGRSTSPENSVNSENVDNGSVSSNTDTPKKEKKGLKRFFRKVF